MNSTTSVDPGPRWYAPLAAAGIAALTLVNGDTEARGLTVWLGVLALSLGVILFDAKRQSINFGPLGKNKLVLVGLVALFVLAIAVWSASVETVGYDDFVPLWVVVGWAITTAILLGLREVFLRQ